MGEKHLTIKDLPISERPYEKCERYGAAMLTDAELLAVMIKTGTRASRSIDLAHKILNLPAVQEGLLGLNYLKLNELMELKGIGRVKAIQIQCIAELSKRMSKASAAKRMNCNNPMTIADYFMEDMRHLTQEQLVLLMLDTKNKVIREKVLTVGTVNASLISPREIFIEAVKNDSVNIIILHNHPSGDPTPSREDILVTRRIQEAGDLIGIQLLDHIIIGDQKYISMKEQGIF